MAQKVQELRIEILQPPVCVSSLRIKAKSAGPQSRKQLDFDLSRIGSDQVCCMIKRSFIPAVTGPPETTGRLAARGFARPFIICAYGSRLAPSSASVQSEINYVSRKLSRLAEGFAQRVRHAIKVCDGTP